MSTATALKPRPFVFTMPIVTIDLVKALPEDLKVYDATVNKEVLRENLIFWLKSNLSGKIQGTPYITSKNTSPEDLKEWLDNDMIYIAKSPFN